MKLYIIYYPDIDKFHSMQIANERESVPGIVCCRERTNIELWIQGLVLSGNNVDDKIEPKEITLNALKAECRDRGYPNIWVIDNGIEDREIIYLI
jgi:hypothetical protein